MASSINNNIWYNCDILFKNNSNTINAYTYLNNTLISQFNASNAYNNYYSNVNTLGLLFSIGRQYKTVTTSTADMIAWYKFDGDYTDSSGNGRAITPYNSPTFNIPNAVLNKSLYISGSSYLTVPSYNYGQHNGLSFALWIRFEDSNPYATVFEFSTGMWINSIRVTRDGPGNRIRLTSGINGGSEYNAIIANSIVIGQWAHYVFVLNKSPRYWKIYMNGVNQELITFGIGIFLNDPFPFPQSVTLTNSKIGLDANNGTKFTGYIDDFRIYNRVLTAAEVSDLYTGIIVSISEDASPCTISDFKFYTNEINRLFIEPTLYSQNNITSNISLYPDVWYQFIEDPFTCNIVTDAGTSNLSMTIIGNFFYNTVQMNAWYGFDISSNIGIDNTVKANDLINYNVTYDISTFKASLGSAYFSSTNSSEYMISSNSTSFAPDYSFTYSMWVKANINTAYQDIISCKNTLTEPFGGFKFGINNANSTSAYITTYTNNSNVNTLNISNFADNSWKHIVFNITYLDVNSQTLNVYVNGTSNIYTYSGLIYSPVNTNLVIGKDIEGSNYLQSANIDDIRMYNRTLTTTEILYLYNYSKPSLQYPPSSLGYISTENTTLPTWYSTISSNTNKYTHGLGQYTTVSSSVYQSNIISYPITGLFNYANENNIAYFSSNTYNIGTGFYSFPTYNSTLDGSYYGEWVYLQMPNPIIPTRIEILQNITYPNRSPGRYKLYASNDGISWTLLHDNSVTTITYINYTHVRTISSNRYFKYIAIVINKLFGNENWLNFAQFRIFGIPNKYNENSSLFTNKSSLYPTVSSSNMVAWYKFDISSNNMFLDSSGNNNTLISNASYGFDSSNYIRGTGSLFTTISNNTSYLRNTSILFTNTAFTISFWIRPTLLDTTTRWIVSKGSSTTSLQAAFVELTSIDSDFMYFNFGFVGYNLYSPKIWKNTYLNTWTHISVTWNAATYERFLYVNGFVMANDTQVVTLNASSTFTVGNNNSISRFYRKYR